MVEGQALWRAVGSAVLELACAGSGEMTVIIQVFYKMVVNTVISKN